VTSVQTVLGGQGADSRDFIDLLRLFLLVTGFVYLLVIGFLTVALLRRRREEPEKEPRFRGLLVGWVGFVALGLLILTLGSFFTDRSMAANGARPALEVEITAKQWWWDIRYFGADPSQTLRTSNELHLPAGMPVHISLKSEDVIHSFWVPNLAGKQDLIPGRNTDITLTPMKTGLYRAQCAEFCGVQHAHMALDVTVEPKDKFLSWYAAGLQPAKAPANPLQLAGYQYITTHECASCHNISGTPASGGVGPDLTHLASRRSIAAGTLPMERGNLYAWVADPQSQKPGNKMPVIGLEPNELHGIVAYLESLK
jgi:cytochrome c oxidase subunit 2